MTCPSPAPINPRHPALAPSFEPFYYQTAADAAVQAEMDAGVSRTLVVLPTGTGKTYCMVLLVPRFGLPVLFLAHKGEGRWDTGESGDGVDRRMGDPQATNAPVRQRPSPTDGPTAKPRPMGLENQTIRPPH